MEVQIFEKDANRLRFLVQGIDVAVANALRRIMISEVPSMAIDDVIILENPSPMRDEMLAHRLGLIPLKTDLESYVSREQCDCHSELGCGKCSVTLTLEADATDATRVVYSEELKSNDPFVIPVSGKIPILKLARNQKIRLEAYARLGQGSEHAKWQPVSVCTIKRVEDNEDTFMFNIESTGVLAPERILDFAVDALREKAQEFIDHVSNLKLEGGDDEETS